MQCSKVAIAHLADCNSVPILHQFFLQEIILRPKPLEVLHLAQPAYSPDVVRLGWTLVDKIRLVQGRLYDVAVAVGKPSISVNPTCIRRLRIFPAASNAFSWS